MRIVEQVAVIASLRQAQVCRVGQRVALGLTQPEGLAVKAAFGRRQSAFEFHAVCCAEVVDPLQIAARVLPTALKTGIVLQARRARKCLAGVGAAVVPVAFLQKALPGQGFIVADLPVQAWPQVDAVAKIELLALLLGQRWLTIQPGCTAQYRCAVTTPPFKQRDGQGKRHVGPLFTNRETARHGWAVHAVTHADTQIAL